MRSVVLAEDPSLQGQGWRDRALLLTSHGTSLQRDSFQLNECRGPRGAPLTRSLLHHPADPRLCARLWAPRSGRVPSTAPPLCYRR